MKKMFLIATVLSVFSIGSRAQSKNQDFTFGGGLNLNLPTGDFSNGWNLGLGFQFQGELKIAQNASAVFTTGYTEYFGKDVNLGGFGFTTPNVGFIPFLAGIRIYPSEGFFIGAQAGFGTFTNTGASGNSGFDFYPQIGFNGRSAQFILGYNIISVTAGSNANVGMTAIFKFKH
jgi:hypothetical protein